jgi:hypothetical protein
MGDRASGLVETVGAIATDLEQAAGEIARRLEPLQPLPQRARDGVRQALAGQPGEPTRQPIRFLIL